MFKGSLRNNRKKNKSRGVSSKYSNAFILNVKSILPISKHQVIQVQQLDLVMRLLSKSNIQYSQIQLLCSCAQLTVCAITSKFH